MNILNILTPKRRLGNFGEDAACKYLKKHGYKILERNYVALNKEIDIIASKDSITAFVEVKTRTLGKENPNEPRPASAVTPRKMRDIMKAAKCYIAINRPSGRIRFDVVEVYAADRGKRTVAERIDHITSAFNYNSSYDRRNI